MGRPAKQKEEKRRSVTFSLSDKHLAIIQREQGINDSDKLRAILDRVNVFVVFNQLDIENECCTLDNYEYLSNDAIMIMVQSGKDNYYFIDDKLSNKSKEQIIQQYEKQGYTLQILEDKEHRFYAVAGEKRGERCSLNCLTKMEKLIEELRTCR